MFLASKALICALALDFAETGAALKFADTLGSLMQAKSVGKNAALVKLIGALQETPGAIGDLNDALSDVIAELEANVETKIQAGFQSTQNTIDSTVHLLGFQTHSAVSMKADADTADSSWISCVGDEKSKLEAVEAAEVALRAAEHSVILPCQQQVDRTHFDFTPAMDFKFSCDFATAGLCTTQLDSYSAQVNDMLSSMDADTRAAAVSWNEAKNACDAAHADVAAKTSELEAANVAYDGQRETCFEQHEARQLTLCAFGTSLHHKCNTVADYNTLMAEIEQVNGGDHSQPDREAEWQTTQTTKCMLSEVINSGDITDQTLIDCENAVNFAAEVGVLDRKQTEFEQDITPDNFSCAETAITFGGEAWETPSATGATPHSSDYKLMPYHPAFDVANPFAFDFCGGQ